MDVVGTVITVVAIVVVGWVMVPRGRESPRQHGLAPTAPRELTVSDHPVRDSA